MIEKNFCLINLHAKLRFSDKRRLESMNFRRLASSNPPGSYFHAVTLP